MKSKWIIGCGLTSAIVLTLLLGGCFVYISDGNGHHLRSEAKRTDELTASLADITALEVSTNLGAINVEARDVTEAAIIAKITVRAQTEEEANALLDGVRIQPEPSGHTLVVKAIKPSDFGYNSLAVEFTITIPRQLGTHCTTRVGDIRITGLAGDIVARTDVGKIECTDLRSGKADLATNVGDIKASYASDAPAALRVDAGTNVGTIDFSGPDHISAKVSAATHVGDIHANREMSVRGFVHKSLDATLDNGEGRIALQTNVGDIHIR
jgi:hypothetical protein